MARLPGSRAAFLDRDGVLVADTDGPARRPRRLLAGVGLAVAELTRRGWITVVVTNQPVVARGQRTEEEVEADNAAIGALVAGAGGRIDAFYVCPHHPQAEQIEYRVDCDCRKPRPGLLIQAAADLGVDLGRSVMIGDRMTDLEAGSRAGCGQLILVETGMHTRPRIQTDAPPLAVTPDARVDDLAAAIKLVLGALTPGVPASPR